MAVRRWRPELGVCLPTAPELASRMAYFSIMSSLNALQPISSVLCHSAQFVILCVLAPQRALALRTYDAALNDQKCASCGHERQENRLSFGHWHSSSHASGRCSVGQTHADAEVAAAGS